MASLTVAPSLFLLFFLFHTGGSMMVARCPVKWQQRGGTDQCYLIHSTGQARTFSDARDYCKAYNGDLVIIGSVAMKNWLSLAVAETGDVGQAAYVWVGAQYVDNAWKWIEIGEDVDTNVVQFEGTGEGSCAAFTANSKLIKQDCSQKLNFVCHRNITVPPPCDYDTGWEEMNKYCYKKSEVKNSWYDSLVNCEIEGGSLLTIETNIEQQMAIDLALDARDNVWIGLNEQGHAGQFTWVDGEESNYTHWKEGQPDLSYNGFGAAVVDKSDDDGHWVVEKVTDQYHYICKKVQGSCLPGWEVFEDSCYYFNTEDVDSLVWEDAKGICESVGASLVVLDTVAEDAFFYDHIPENDQLWLGLYSKPQDNLYWTDGTVMSSKNFSYMTTKDMNDAIQADEQQCVFFQIGESDVTTPISSWVPTDCHIPRHYACEVPAGQPVILIPPSNERYCPDGWEKESDHCYMFSTQEMSWSAAASSCASQDSTLVSILSWREQDFVKLYQQGGSWIGLNDRKTENAWIWSDGSSVTITNWNVGEPTGGGENCAQMLDTGKWNDIPCDLQLVFSCKKKASSTPIGTLTTTTAEPDSK